MNIRILRTAAVAALACALLGVGPLAHAGAGTGTAQAANSVHRTSSRTMHGEVQNAGSSSFQLLATHTSPSP